MDIENTEALGAYLEKQVADFSHLLECKKFEGGQSNPSYLIVAESGRYVLRSQPPGKLFDNAHAIDREYRVMKALHSSSVAVPEMLHYCSDSKIIGREFYLMSFADGRIFWDPALEEIPKEERGAFHYQLVDTLVNLHNIDVGEIGLSDYGKGQDYFERQIKLWSKQYRMVETEPNESMDLLLKWLPENLPEDDQQLGLIHGDFRIDNFVFANDSSDLVAVLDWELSTLGHPISDLAYFCMCLRLPRFGDIKGLMGLDAVDLGLPSEQDLIDHYCRQRGIERIDNWNYYLVFSFFRLAAISQGVYKRALSGNASNKKAMFAGQAVQFLADMAITVTREDSNDWG